MMLPGLTRGSPRKAPGNHRDFLSENPGDFYEDLLGICILVEIRGDWQVAGATRKWTRDMSGQRSHNMGRSPNKWMVCNGESHRSKWMMTRGTPISGNADWKMVMQLIYFPKTGDQNAWRGR